MDPLKELKGFDAGRQLAIVKMIGGKDVVDAVLRGEKTIIVEDAIRSLFDKHGRRIPESLQANVCDANWNFRLDQPELGKEVDFANRIMRLHGCLSVDTEITAEQFKTETERLLTLIRDNPLTANIVKGVWLPVILPQLMIDDLGETLEQYLEAVGKSYAKDFSDRTFYNHCKSIFLANNVNIINRSRHDQLIERMRREPVMGIHFPNPLQGFSINASREQMSTLQEGFILSGMDTPIAMAMYPDILARNYNPRLNMAALSLWFADFSLYFWADGGKLVFGRTGSLASPSAGYSGGLLFLG